MESEGEFKNWVQLASYEKQVRLRPVGEKEIKSELITAYRGAGFAAGHEIKKVKMPYGMSSWRELWCNSTRNSEFRLPIPVTGFDVLNGALGDIMVIGLMPQLQRVLGLRPALERGQLRLYNNDDQPVIAIRSWWILDGDGSFNRVVINGSELLADSSVFNRLCALYGDEPLLITRVTRKLLEREN